MPPPNSSVLEQLYRLDDSSAAFHDRLGGILDGEEYKQSVSNLQTNDLLWLADYLDKVRLPASIPRSPLKSVQALDSLSPTSVSFQKCLREFRDICSTKMILPTSYAISSSLLNIGRHPVASGGPCDVYEGTFNDSRVYIKRIRVYSQDDRNKATKAGCPTLPLSAAADKTHRRSTTQPLCGNT